MSDETATFVRAHFKRLGGETVRIPDGPELLHDLGEAGSIPGQQID